METERQHITNKEKGKQLLFEGYGNQFLPKAGITNCL